MLTMHRTASTKTPPSLLPWRIYPARPLLPGVRRVRKIEITIAAATLFLLGSLYRKYYQRSESALALAASQYAPPFNTAARNIYSLAPPDLFLLRVSSEYNRTVYIIPSSELRCKWQFNYFCKFYYSIRCYLLGGFERVVILPSVHELKIRARAGDIALLPHRSKRHDETPARLSEINDWRHADNASKDARALRIGVFHVSNELDRSNWPWYSDADFVLRNYWLPGRTPPHVQYIPLGHQMPSQCTPESPMDDSRSTQSTCGCAGANFARASRRRNLYSFSGSLRHGREKLMKKVRQSRILHGRGELLVSRRFGGDGVFGGGEKDPKIGHVQALLDAAFVLAPCGNVMETHRIYEALALGAIPVIEDCEGEPNSNFFPLKEIVMKGHDDMLRFVAGFVGRPAQLDALQVRVLQWWHEYAVQVAENVTRVALTAVPRELIFAP